MLSRIGSRLARLAVLLILLLCIQAVTCRRAGRGGGFRSRRRTTSRRRTSYRKHTKTHTSRPTGRSDKGGIKTFGKVVLATYLAKKMTPSVGFRPYGGYDIRRHARLCHECISINGSDIGCEKGSVEDGSLKKCDASMLMPYCSTEYGITADEMPYVRRSCNDRKCETCTSHLSNITGTDTAKCYTIQCDLCNWDKCNNQSSHETFHEKWTGCPVDNAKRGATFTADEDTCGGCSPSGKIQLTMVASLVSAFVLKM